MSQQGGDHPLENKDWGAHRHRMREWERQHRVQRAFHWLWHTLAYWLAICLAAALIGAMIFGALLTG